jgi:hypothetical protein
LNLYSLLIKCIFAERLTKKDFNFPYPLTGDSLLWLGDRSQLTIQIAAKREKQIFLVAVFELFKKLEMLCA